MRKYISIVLPVMALLLFFILPGCAPVTPIDACVTDIPYGFWYGLLHGFISPFTFTIGLFKDDVAMYAVNNNGGWYDFGFLLGAMIIFGGSGNRAR
jgi:hypothetical protein